MLAHRNFGLKRSHLAARAASQPTNPNNSKGNADPLTVFSSATPTSTTAESSTTPSSSSSPSPSPSPTPSSSSSSPSSPSSPSVPTTPVSSPSSPSSPPSTSAASSAPTSPTVTIPISSAASSGLKSSPVSTSNPLIVTTQAVSGISYTPTSSLAPAATSSPSSSSGSNTSAIIGGVVGTLAGITVLGLLLVWCMRRQRSHDFEDFDAQAFKRQSAILMDDPVEPPQSYNPRPPTMIEQHNVSPALAAQSGYGGQNFFGSYGGYGQQPPYPAPERPQQAYVAPSVGHAGYDNPHQQLARQPSDMGYPDYDTPQHLATQPSNGAYLTRQPSAALPTSPPRSLDPNAHYIDLSRSSISPYQAAQYADISRQLGTTDIEVPQESEELPDDPLPSPFDDPADANPVPNVTSHHPQRPMYPVVQPHGNAPAIYQRPPTHYEEGDAYGGI